MTVLQKTGYALLLNIVFILCSLPIVTIGASVTSFYYAMTKSVRHERGYVLREFFNSFLRVLPKSILYELLFAGAGVLLFMNREYSAAAGGTRSVVFVAVYDVLIALCAALLVWTFPVISRFSLSFPKTIALICNAAFRFLARTAALLALTCISVLLMWKLSVGFVLIVPAAACYASSYIIEPAFKVFIPKPEDHSKDAWYYDGSDKDELCS